MSLTYVEALRDPRLLGALPAFADLSTWRNWITFLNAVEGLPLDADEVATFCRFTGRSQYTPPAGGFPEAVAIVGRQSGKSRISAAIQAVEAMRWTGTHDGSDVYALSIAQDQRSALRVSHKYATSPFEHVAALKATVAGRTADAVTLTSGAVLAAYPCRPAAVRGLRAIVVVLDELAHFKSSENVPVDGEMLRAIRPTLATTGGRLVILSSPYGSTGALWDLHRQHYGRDDSTTLVWQASAPEMNPTLSADYLARMARDDPEGYRSEVLGEFRAGLSMLFDPEALDAVVDRGVRERAPEPGVRYFFGLDHASGTGMDRLAFAVAHAVGDVAVLDYLSVRHPPFNPSVEIAACCGVARSYGGREIRADRFALGFLADVLRANGLTYRPLDHDRSGLYLESLPLVNTARIRLLDRPELLRELRGLERTRGASGRDRVDHRRTTGAHDDAANAACAALLLAAESVRVGRDRVATISVRDVERRRSPFKLAGDVYTDAVGRRLLAESHEARRREGARLDAEARALRSPAPRPDPHAFLRQLVEARGCAYVIELLKAVNGADAPIPSWLTDPATKRSA